MEDKEHVRHPAIGFLKKCGYTVMEAPDGLRTVDTASEQSGRIDRMISDVAMPG